MKVAKPLTLADYNWKTKKEKTQMVGSSSRRSWKGEQRCVVWVIDKTRMNHACCNRKVYSLDMNLRFEVHYSRLQKKSLTKYRLRFLAITGSCRSTIPVPKSECLRFENDGSMISCLINHDFFTQKVAQQKPKFIFLPNWNGF